MNEKLRTIEDVLKDNLNNEVTIHLSEGNSFHGVLLFVGASHETDSLVKLQGTDEFSPHITYLCKKFIVGVSVETQK